MLLIFVAFPYLLRDLFFFHVEPKNIQIEKYRILSTSFIVLHSEERKMQNILQKYKKYILTYLHTYKHQTTQSTLPWKCSSRKKNTFSFASLNQKIVLEGKKKCFANFFYITSRLFPHFSAPPPWRYLHCGSAQSTCTSTRWVGDSFRLKEKNTCFGEQQACQNVGDLAQQVS